MDYLFFFVADFFTGFDVFFAALLPFAAAFFTFPFPVWELRGAVFTAAIALAGL